MKEGYPIVVRMTQADVDAGKGDSLVGMRVEVIDSSGTPTEVVYESGAVGTPTLLVTGGNINTVMQSAGGTGWEKVQITTAAYQLKPATNGASRDFHIEAGGDLAILLPADWPIPTSPKVDVFKIRNFSGSAVVFEVFGYSGIVTADDNAATPAALSYSIRNDGMVVVSIDSDGWVQVVPSAEVSQAEYDALNTLVLNHGLASNNPHSTTKTHVGLGGVDNTADVDKPVSTATQTALNAKQNNLVSGTTIKTVNGASVLGTGDITIAADLPGGTAQTATDDGLVSGNAVVDRSTVVGQTILKYTTTGASTFKAPVGVTSVQVLVVAGGAGGGSGVGGDLRGGGGGAGGLISNAAFAVTPDAILTVTVGAGGAAAINGSNSVFGTLDADGGGRGGSGPQTGLLGGSGGGGGAPSGGTASFAGGAGTAGEGNAGGEGGTDGTTYRNGGGGGGANAVGVGAATTGAGGAGFTSAITGASITYAGGGGGGGPVAANGGAGGGGRGGAYPGGVGIAGTVNTGGGGGGGANAAAGAAGGSGVVIVRFTTQSRTYTALATYADNLAAVTAGLFVGEFYKNQTTGAVQQVQ